MGVLSRTMPDGEPRRKVLDPELKDERKTVFKMYFINFLCVTAAIWCIISIYFGAYYRQTENAYRLTIRILDMDSQYARVVAGAPAAIMGPAVVQAAERTIAAMPNYHLGYQFASEDELSLLKVTQDGQGQNASEYAMELVLNQDVFGVILINPNATVLATEAALNGIATYDPRGAVSFFYEEARNFYSENQYVSLHSTRLIETAIAEASLEFVRLLFTTAGTLGVADTAALQTALNGNALSYPFYYNQHNLRPFDQLAAEAAVTAGQIYLIIFTFFMSPIWLKAFENLRRKLTLSSQLLVQWGVPVACYFWISLNYSLVTLAFKTDFTRKYGYGGFPLFWANNWLSMTALGFVMETMLRIAGPLYFPFFLLFWVVWNVSTAFLDLSDQDPFYMYGFAFPVWNSIDTSKSIIFGTKDHLLQNFMVNLGWVIGGSIALLCVVTYNRKKEERQELEERVKQRKEQQSS